MKNVILWLEHHPKLVRIVLLCIAFSLTLKVLWPLLLGHVEPFLYQSLMAQTGQTALIYLIAALAITPLRRWLTIVCKFYKLSFGKRLSDWNLLIRHRRNIGVTSGFFSLMHLTFYIWLDMGLLFSEIWWDVTSRPFILLGWMSFFIMMVLTVTSPKRMQRWLKKKWRTVHKSVYVMSPLIVLHFALSLKPEHYDYVVYAVIIFLLLLHRAYFKLKKDLMNKFDDGMEARR